MRVYHWIFLIVCVWCSYFITRETEKSKITEYNTHFTKSFEHDSETGLLTTNGQESYKQLLHALDTGSTEDFELLVKLSPKSIKLHNAQTASLASEKLLRDSLFVNTHAPDISSPEAAAVILEAYWQALCRDIRFEDYGTGKNSDDDGNGHSITIMALDVLSSLGSAYQGPQIKNNSALQLFRGKAQGDVQGNYISQFLLLLLHPLGQKLLSIKQYVPVASNREFGITWQDFIDLHNGNTPRGYLDCDFDGSVRYPITGRDLATYVHFNNDYEPFYNAIAILDYHKVPLAKNITTASPIKKFSSSEAYRALGAILPAAMKLSWTIKWRKTLFPRPEEFAALVHRVKITGENPYNLHRSIFKPHNNIDTLQHIYHKNQTQPAIYQKCDQDITKEQASTYLLGQVYPEGSPLHPSCPSNHALLAGAYSTLLKAYYDDQVLLSSYIDPVLVDPRNPKKLIALDKHIANKLTLSGELDKLASNIAFGRNFAGIHYRCDADDGLFLGEQIAIDYLQEKATEYGKEFKGFEFTQRNGNRIHVTANSIVKIEK